MYNVEWTPSTSHITYWHVEVHQYLENGTMPSHFSMQQKRALWLRFLSYQLMDGVLYKEHRDGILLKCMDGREWKKVLHDVHDGPNRGNFMGNTIVKRSLAPFSTSLHYLRMHMPMTASIQPVRDASTQNKGQQPCYSLLQWKNHSNSDAWI